MILFAVYVCCLCVHLKLLLYLLHNSYFYSTIIAAGISWLPRFDSMRGCCRTPRRTWSRISMRVKGGGWGSRLALAILGDTSCQCFLRHFKHLNHSSCQIQITAVLWLQLRELQLQYPDIYGITSSVSRVNLFYSWYLAFANRRGQSLQSKHQYFINCCPCDLVLA